MPEAPRCGAEGLETMANLRRVLRGRVIRLEIHLNGASLRVSKQSGVPNPGQRSGDGEGRDRTAVLYLEEQQHGDSRGEVVSDWCEGSLGIQVNTEYNSKDRQATRPERLAEPDLGSLAYVFQMLYTHLYKPEKRLLWWQQG